MEAFVLRREKVTIMPVVELQGEGKGGVLHLGTFVFHCLGKCAVRRCRKVAKQVRIFEASSEVAHGHPGFKLLLWSTIPGFRVTGGDGGYLADNQVDGAHMQECPNR